MSDDQRYVFEMPVCMQCKKALCEPRYINIDGEGFCSARCEEDSLQEYMALEGYGSIEMTESIAYEHP
jgi:hypothetical protein